MINAFGRNISRPLGPSIRLLAASASPSSSSSCSACTSGNAFSIGNRRNVQQQVPTTPTTATPPTPPPAKRGAASNAEWMRAFTAAEKVVGYPTSFLSLRWLLSDEIANVAIHLRKLVGSQHPLLKTAKNLLYNGKSNMQAWGLIILLLSKSAGQSQRARDAAAAAATGAEAVDSGVLPSQRALAEVTEMIRISHLVHQGLINLQPLAQAGQDLSLHGEMTFGNKIALLSGDYLLGNSCAELAQLRNQQLVELISSAVRDLAEAEFIGDRDEQNNPLPARPIKPDANQPEAAAVAIGVDVNAAASAGGGAAQVNNLQPIEKQSALGHAEREWEMRHLLSTGSLLGKSCQGAMILADQPVDVQQLGYDFGKHLALAWQARLDLEPFESDDDDDELRIGATFSLVSAPVMYHLQFAPECYDDIRCGQASVENVDYRKLHRAIRQGPAVLQSQRLLRKHTLRSMKCLNQFAPSEARTALQNIILAMQEM